MCPITSRVLYKFPLVKQIVYLLVILTMLFGCRDSFVAKAQSSGSTTGTLAGKVTDSQGAVISGVRVSIRQIETNLLRTTQTGEDGVYKISQLPPGEYEIIAEAENFTSMSEKTEVNIGVTKLSKFVLPIGTTNSETIEVTASSVFEAEKTESSNSINRNRIDSLPINRRNFLDFTLTTPRVVQDRVPAQGVSASSGLSFNGQSARLNNITIDGLDNNETATGTVRATFSQEAVQEFQVVSDSFSTEFGHASGGVINIVTKGGSNDYHGSLFFLNRNDETSARDVFAPFEPDYKQYQFGATFSGPIRKDKAFFFSSFERLSIKQNQFVTIGDQTVTSARGLGFNLANGPIPFSLGTTSLLGRLDLRLSPQNSFFVRYNFGGNYNGNFDPFGGLVGEGNAGIQKLEDNNVALNNTYISPNLGFIIESRLLYANRNQEIDQIVNEPQVRLVAPEGLVRFGRSTLLPQPRKTPIFQVVNNFTLVKGKNQIKFGVDFTNINPDDKSTVPILNGGLAIFQPIDFTALTGIPNLPFFTGLQTFDPKLRTPEQLAFLDLASAQAPILFPGFPSNIPLRNLPLPFAFVQGFGDTKVSVQQRIFSSFIQNDIKLTPNLLVKVGLRYDISRERFIPSNNGNFSPRLSVAYRPSKISNLSLRAAYGVFYGTQLFAIAATTELTTVKKSLVIPVVAFPFSILPFSLPERRFPESNSVPSQIDLIPQLNTTFQYDPGFRNGYTQQLTMGFNYLLTSNTQVAATYNHV
ncbi:MAG: ferrienterochelin and colicins outer membrane receptor, partial [bacterium]